MTVTTNTAVDNQEYELANDATGLDEIQKAIDEIEKLKNPTIEEDDSELESAVESETLEENTAEDITQEDNSKKDKKEDKLWKIKKEKYQALAEKETLMQENLHLKQMLNESLNSGTYHYGKSAYYDLEKAKDSKKRAIEEGNVDALVEADIALTKAINTINELEKWAYNDSQNQNKRETSSIENQTNNFSAVEQEIATDWLENHSYLQPSSSDYDPKLANKVAEFINYLDKSLAQNGQKNAYFSEPYFQTIENYITELKNAPQKTAKRVESSAHIGGVRNSYGTPTNGKANSPNQIILTADERRMCANAGISEKEWLKYKLEDLKRGK